jgi:hypothetical protein
VDIRQQENAEASKIRRPPLGTKVCFCEGESSWELPAIGTPNPDEVRINIVGDYTIESTLGQFHETLGRIEPAAFFARHRTGWSKLSSLECHQIGNVDAEAG